MNLPSHFTVKNRVIATFIRNDFTPKECSCILDCSLDTIYSYTKSLKRKEKCRNLIKPFCDYLENGWIRTFTPQEVKHYKLLAENNMKRPKPRKESYGIDWQKMHDELYPS